MLYNSISSSPFYSSPVTHTSSTSCQFPRSVGHHLHKETRNGAWGRGVVYVPTLFKFINDVCKGDRGSAFHISISRHYQHQDTGIVVLTHPPQVRSYTNLVVVIVDSIYFLHSVWLLSHMFFLLSSRRRFIGCMFITTPPQVG